MGTQDAIHDTTCLDANQVRCVETCGFAWDDDASQFSPSASERRQSASERRQISMASAATSTRITVQRIIIVDRTTSEVGRGTEDENVRKSFGIVFCE
jgi:hypothetical protein